MARRPLHRPLTRAECADGPRPCPWWSCRYHLRVESRLPVLVESCALDVADGGGATLEEVGNVLGVSRERIRQIEAEALAKLAALGSLPVP